MSVIKEHPRRGTTALGKRDLPDIDYQQLDHPIAKILDPKGGDNMLSHMEREAFELTYTFMKANSNPSLRAIEQYVLEHVKAAFVRFKEVQALRWCSQLPPSVQKIVNDAYYNKRQEPRPAGQGLLTFADKWY
jgi:hypothetical protein